METLTEKAIREVWSREKARFNVRKGYMRVDVDIRPPLEVPLGPANMPAMSEVLASRHTLEFELGYDGPDYVVSCRGVEVERGNANTVLLGNAR